MALLGALEGIGTVNDGDQDIGKVTYQIRIESVPGHSKRRAIGRLRGDSGCLHQLFNANKEWVLILDTEQKVMISPTAHPQGQNQDEIDISINTPIAGY